MAKRRLNKKVALIGSLVFVFFVLAAIVLILYLSRDPTKPMKDGDMAVAAAREAIDEQIREQEYKRAGRNYQEAYKLTRTDLGRVEILFRLADTYVETDEWHKVLQCWNQIIRLVPENVKARFGRLKYLYIMADSGWRGGWQEVVSQAAELIEVAEEKNLFAKETSQWDPFESRQERAGQERLGPYLYLVRGRAMLEITRMGASTDRDESLAQAIDDLERVHELEPNNVDAFLYMAGAAITEGEIHASRGEFGERDKAEERVEALMERAVKVAGADPRPDISLLSLKLARARRSDPDQVEEQVVALEGDYRSLVEEFPSSAEAFSALADFYRFNPKNLDKAVEAAEKAVELDKENVTYAIGAARLYYNKFSVYGEKSQFYKAIEVAKNALTLPDAQDVTGPRRWANRMNRISLYFLLAECYIEQVIEPRGPRTEVETEEWLAEAEQAVHEIGQLLGSGDAPDVVKWQGLLDLAKGNRSRAIKKMLMVYEQLKSVERKDSLLSFRLAKALENTTEIGAVQEFLASALRRPGGIHVEKPSALLDYANVLLRLRNYGGALSTVDFFERRYWTNEKSKRTRIYAYIGAGQFEKAEEELAKRDPDDPNTIKLHMAVLGARIRQLKRAIAQEQIEQRLPVVLEDLVGPEEAVKPEKSVQLMTADLKRYWEKSAQLVEKLLATEADSVGVDVVVSLCQNYIVEGRIGDAKALVNTFLEHFPDNTIVLFYKRLLSEPEPGKVEPERQREIEEQALLNIADPVRRAIALGRLYRRYNELGKAAVEFRKVFRIGGDLQEGTEETVLERAEQTTNTRRIAANNLFEIALATKDWKLAEQITETARRENLDDCSGEFFAARFAVAREEYGEALRMLDGCLKQKPVFSRGFLLRSTVNAALGNEHASIDDARKAIYLNPLDGAIAKRLAFVLYQRNQKLGDKVSSDQVIETKRALLTAISENPYDFQIQSFYAEYIRSTEPSKALAIRQHLQRVAPSVENALLLGRMAMRLALDEINEGQKNAYFDIAASSFEEARAMNPNDRAALQAQADYYRVRGQDKKAEQLLLEAKDEKLLWVHYFQAGRFADAKRVLQQLYKGGAKDGDVIKGLLLVAEKTADKAAVKRYSEELLLISEQQLAAEGTADAQKSIIEKGLVESHLLQIQTFLKTGLVREAELKLQSFNEKFRNESRALLLEAWLAMRQGRLKEALELINRNLETDQDNALAWRLRGEANLLMANNDQAIDDLRTSKSLSPLPATRLVLAKAYVRARRVEEAITELKNAIDQPSMSLEGAATEQESRELLEQVYLRFGKKEALKGLYAETIEKFPDDILWYKRAGAFALAEAEFGRAEQLYGLAWQKSRNGGKGDTGALDGYLQALVLSAGLPNEANVTWKPARLDKVFEEGGKYTDTDFAPIAYMWMAEAKMKLGDKATATQYCRKALAKAFAEPEPDEAFAAKILQRTYSLLGAEEVVKYCMQRLETNPDSLGANMVMFSVMKLNGEYNKALGYIDKCLQTLGSDSPLRVNYVMRKVAVLELAYNRTSDNTYLKEATAEYESLLAKMPNNTVVLNNLAYVLAKNNERLAEALEYARRACEAVPDNPGILDTYAYVLHRNGKNSEADERVQAALQLYEQNRIPVPVDVYEHLGMIKEKLGAVSEALNAYEQALETGGDTLSEVTKRRLKAAIERLSRQDGAND